MASPAGGLAGGRAVRRAARLVPAVLALCLTAARAEEGLVPYTIVGDAIPEPLAGTPGDPARGRAIVADRSRGLCLLCLIHHCRCTLFQAPLEPLSFLPPPRTPPCASPFAAAFP